MTSVKDLGEPRWTKGPWEVKDDFSGHGFYIDAPAAKDSARANATLFAAAPELAKAVREYLEGLEDRVVQAERLTRGARELSMHGRTPYSVVMARIAEADARRALSAASPLYAALAMAYGKTKEAESHV